MASLARNTYYNISAFASNTILSLITVTVLVRGYGLSGYGLIILARLLLPSGILGLLEAGFPEVMARTVAVARTMGDLEHLARRLSAACLMAAVIGACAAILLAILTDEITTVVFHSAIATREELHSLILVSVFSLPLQLVGSVLRGAFEGSERFALVRSVEVLSNTAYLVIIGVMLVGYNTTSVDAALAYVWIWNTRSALYFGIVLLGARTDISFGTRNIWSGSGDFFSHAMQLFFNKFFSMLLNFGPSIVLGAFSTVATVGSYEIIMRIPKVLKTISGMFNGALLPFAARADAIGDQSSVRRVIEDGTILVVSIVGLLSAVAMIFSADLLHYWLGIVNLELALYLRIALIWPILVASLGIGSTVLVSRRAAAASTSRLSMFTTLCYFLLAASLYRWLDWRAFVLALVVSQLLTVPAYWRLIRNEYDIKLGPWLVFSAKLMVIIAAGFLLHWATRPITQVAGVVMFMIEAGIVTLIMGLGIYLFALPPNARRMIQHFFQQSVSRLWP